jgi:hypothetical protein
LSGGQAARRRRRLQATSSQASSAGTLTAQASRKRFNHCAGPAASKAAPSATTPCTPSSARSTTPTWQTSVIGSPGGGASCASGDGGVEGRLCIGAMVGGENPRPAPELPCPADVVVHQPLANKAQAWSALFPNR